MLPATHSCPAFRMMPTIVHVQPVFKAEVVPINWIVAITVVHYQTFLLMSSLLFELRLYESLYPNADGNRCQDLLWFSTSVLKAIKSRSFETVCGPFDVHCLLRPCVELKSVLCVCVCRCCAKTWRKQTSTLWSRTFSNCTTWRPSVSEGHTYKTFTQETHKFCLLCMYVFHVCVCVTWMCVCM